MKDEVVLRPVAEANLTVIDGILTHPGVMVRAADHLGFVTWCMPRGDLDLDLDLDLGPG